MLPPGSRSFGRMADVGRKVRRETARAAKGRQAEKIRADGETTGVGRGPPNFRSRSAVTRAAAGACVRLLGAHVPRYDKPFAPLLSFARQGRPACACSIEVSSRAPNTPTPALL